MVHGLMTESPPDMLHRVTEWSESNEEVRAAILVGSHAGKDETDEFSDYDIALFVSDQDRYANDQSWLSDLGEVWLCEKNTSWRGDISPVHFRLTVFAPGVGVDFFDPLSQDAGPDRPNGRAARAKLVYPRLSSAGGQGRQNPGHGGTVLSAAGVRETE